MDPDDSHTSLEEKAELQDMSTSTTTIAEEDEVVELDVTQQIEVFAPRLGMDPVLAGDAVRGLLQDEGMVLQRSRGLSNHPGGAVRHRPADPGTGS